MTVAGTHTDFCEFSELCEIIRAHASG